MNPYLQQQADAISRNMTQNLQTNILPGVNSSAVMAGGYGGNRHGIAQGLAIGRTNQAIGDAQANLFGNAYNTDQQIQASKDMQAASLAAQQKIAENQYNLGLGQLGLSALNSGQNFYTTNRGLDLQSMGLGANMVNNANTGLQNQGQALWNLGLSQQQAPWTQLQNWGNAMSPFTGLNGSTSTTTPGGSTIGGAVGGALTAAQLLQLLKG